MPAKVLTSSCSSSTPSLWILLLLRNMLNLLQRAVDLSVSDCPASISPSGENVLRMQSRWAVGAPRDTFGQILSYYLSKDRGHVALAQSSEPLFPWDIDS